MFKAPFALRNKLKKIWSPFNEVTLNLEIRMYTYK